MREIKLRAFNKTDGYWLDSVCLFSDGSWSGTKGIIEGYDDSDCELVFSTGLLDKNGKEGYFNDLVKWGKSIYQVVWDSNEGVAWLKKVSGDEVWNKLRIHLIKRGEIIGNIYENPELLKGGKQWKMKSGK